MPIGKTEIEANLKEEKSEGINKIKSSSEMRIEEIDVKKEEEDIMDILMPNFKQNTEIQMNTIPDLKIELLDIDEYNQPYSNLNFGGFQPLDNEIFGFEQTPRPEQNSWLALPCQNTYLDWIENSYKMKTRGYDEFMGPLDFS